MTGSRILIFLLIYLQALSCSTDNADVHFDSVIIGSWRHSRSYISAGGPQYWIDEENGEIFEFFRDGSFRSTRYAGCETGIFDLRDSVLALKFDCPDVTSRFENEEGFITYKLDLFSGKFHLEPTSGPICIEGCTFEYSKTD